MSRRKKVLLLVAGTLAVAFFLLLHTSIAKRIAGMVVVPRLERALESSLEATVVLGEIDYRLWRGELVLSFLEAEAAGGGFRLSLPETLVDFSLLGGATVTARDPRITLRIGEGLDVRRPVEVPRLSPRIDRLKASGGTLLLRRDGGSVLEVGELHAVMLQEDERHRGTLEAPSATIRNEEGRIALGGLELQLQWNAAGIEIEELAFGGM